MGKVTAALRWAMKTQPEHCVVAEIFHHQSFLEALFAKAAEGDAKPERLAGRFVMLRRENALGQWAEAYLVVAEMRPAWKEAKCPLAKPSHFSAYARTIADAIACEASHTSLTAALKHAEEVPVRLNPNKAWAVYSAFYEKKAKPEVMV